MDAIRRERLAGLLWFLSVVPTGFAFGYVRSTLIVPGDAAATAASIAAHPMLYREGIAALWLTNLLLMGFAIALYPSLRDRQQTLARLFLLAMGLNIAVSMTMTVLQTGAVAVLNDEMARNLGALAAPLSALFARLANSALGVAELLAAPAYAAFGAIVVRTKCMPRLIGFGLIGMGLGFTLNSFEKLLAPHFYPAAFTQLAMALGAIGGLPTMAWLIIKGLAPVSESVVGRHRA